MNETDQSLEQVGGNRKPDIAKIKKELEDSNADAGFYIGRWAQQKLWWNCEWDGMSPDGRSWQQLGRQPFPWDGCSDSRPRTVDTVIGEHVLLSLFAFWSAQVSTKTPRLFPEAKESNAVGKMLKWCIYTQMKRELINELPVALGWKYAYGLSFLGIRWEQQRQITEMPISLQMLSQLTQALQLPDISQKILDPDREYDKDLITVLQSISPILPTQEARKMLTELRNTGQSTIPTANMRVNQPKWTALRPFVDIWFPSETVDIQTARWTAERELVSEAELTDREVTDGYDPDFVKLALEHKGVFSALSPQTSLSQQTIGSNRDLVELFHFRARVLDNGVPCLYKTILCMALGDDDPYAVHRKDEYDHQEYPFAALRRGRKSRPLLHAIGIAEEAYTDEIDIKRQQDGLNDRTELIHQPPMIAPPHRANAIASMYAPRSVMTSLRPDAVVFPPLPPMDQTPVIVMQYVMQRLNRRYPTQNAEGVDPQLVSIYRQFLGVDVLSELEVAFEQTLQLGYQYWSDQDWMEVTGQPKPQQYSQMQIQRKTGVTATTDMTLADPEVAKQKLGMVQELMLLKDAGGLVFQYGANMVDTDLADALTQDQMSPNAMKKETDDEYSAWGQIGAGIYPQEPQMANNQLRMQVIQQILTQPQVQARMGQDKVFATLAQNRIKYFQNQIQQYQTNPQIGRTLATMPFDKSQAAPVTSAPQ